MQTIVPCVAYEDAPAAIAWLKSAFGFTEQLVIPGENGTIAHAQLQLQDNLIMLGTAKPELFGMSTPTRLNGTTMSFYIVESDPDAMHARAVAAGATIVRELNDTDYGSREFICRDPEGHLWGFGTYDPHSPPAGE
jgi:uncharacterized glyoxalase superfamily protein PhnB